MESTYNISLQFLRKNCYFNAAIANRRQQSTPVVVVTDACQTDQEFMSAAKQCEAAPNYCKLLVSFFAL